MWILYYEDMNFNDTISVILSTRQIHEVIHLPITPDMQIGDLREPRALRKPGDLRDLRQLRRLRDLGAQRELNPPSSSS